eukprot:597464-Pyramimonas_sp.AAC.1
MGSLPTSRDFKYIESLLDAMPSHRPQGRERGAVGWALAPHRWHDARVAPARLIWCPRALLGPTGP